MPLLAISDTPLSRKLLLEGRLEVDRFETSGPLTESAVQTLSVAQTPFLLHNGVWNWSLGDPNALADPEVLRQTRERLVLTDAPWLSVHLGFSATHVAFEKSFVLAKVPEAKVKVPGMQPVSEPLSQERTLNAVVQNIRALHEAIGVPLLIENLDYNPTGAYDHVCEPAFIAEVLDATDAGLLLDLAHAQVSASRSGYELETYLAALPLERVRQLHVSGPRSDGETLFDAHEPLREVDYALLADILAKTEPWALTLEYGKDEDALLAQVARLRHLLSA